MTLSRTSDNIITRTLAVEKLVAAPLAGVTTSPFRMALRDFFKGLMYTEMVSVEGLARGGEATLSYIRLNERDNPIGVQLFGSKPESFYDAVKVAEEYAKPDFIDINMGCPVKKVLKNGGGSALLKDLDNIKEIIRSARKASSVPLTVKTRLGWDRDSLVYKEVINIVCGEGADAVTLHGRTKSEMFSGDVDYALLAEAASVSSVPLIANGNVTDLESYNKMLTTGADGIMIGRGMMKMPWIFSALNAGKEPEGFLEAPELHDLIHKMIGYESLFKNEKHFTDSIKKYAVWFSKGLPEAAAFRTEVYASSGLDNLIKLIDSFFISSVTKAE
jgi:nifR3 family TIM-barrel protein